LYGSNIVLHHGDFLGRELSRISAPGFVVTFRRSRSGRRDDQHHHHDTATVLVPFDRGYWSDADGFDESNPLQIIYTPAGTAHRDSMMRLGGRYLAISVDNGLVDEVTPHLRFPVALGGPLAMRVAHRMALMSIKGNSSSVAVEDACLTLLGELDRHRRVNTAPPPWLQRVLEICHSAVDRSPTIAEISRIVAIHPVHVTRVFRRRYGIPLSQYIASIRVERAAAGLRAGWRSVAAVAAENGFTDQSHLCKTFRATLGVTPRTYRASFPGR
jgi:AraC family transcriptional regulator